MTALGAYTNIALGRGLGLGHPTSPRKTTISLDPSGKASRPESRRRGPVGFVLAGPRFFDPWCSNHSGKEGGECTSEKLRR